MAAADAPHDARPDTAVERPARRSQVERGEQRDGTRARLVRAGIEAALERGWAASGVDTILRAVGVPKGSFYHYFASKDDFGYAVLAGYQAFYLKRLDRCFGPASTAGLGAQLDQFQAESVAGMARHGWRRGCLVGALGQELGGLHEGFRERLLASLDEWEQVLAGALERARDRGEIAPGLDARRTARGFWTAWEGAVLRARLAREGSALETTIDEFRQRLGCG